MRRARGFTAVELAVCVSISAILVPSAFLFARTLETTQRVASWHLETANAVQDLDEWFQHDALRSELACHVEYVVTPALLLERRACDGTQVLARGVQRFARVHGGVEISFVLPLREDLIRTTEVFLALETR
ncbi:MAG: prepilin-type N-terminal cleavage/methylation domain-containing protein [Archangium sp.]|nr:prepilin-type N-terminal cleavage/methylation domain-containing protein [Archangium sp.]